MRKSKTLRFSFFISIYLNIGYNITFVKWTDQRAKKVVSDGPGLVDFAIGLVNSVLNLPDRQAKIFWRIKITEVLKTNVLNS